MNRRDDRERDEMIDAAAAGIRGEALDEQALAAIAGRVRTRLGAALEDSPVLDCAALRRLMPAALAGELPEARRTLLDEHVRSCVGCRRAWLDLRAGRTAGAARAPRTRRAEGAAHWRFWAAAAAVLLVLGVGALFTKNALAPAGAGSATVRMLDGILLQVTPAATLPLKLAQPIAYGDHVRTGKGSGAILELPDGTRLEMRERTELALGRDGKDTDIRLARGSVIVRAAKQKAGQHLFVTTDECRVKVVGTIFAVNQGTKGARVSVLEGEVHVAQSGDDTVLMPGDQFTSSGQVEPLPLAEDVAWSREYEAQYRGLIDELVKLRTELAAVPGPGERTSTRLLDLAPAGTVLFAGLPNVGETLDQAHRVFTARLAQSAELRTWWEGQVGAGGHERLDLMVQRLRAFSAELGDEIAIAMSNPVGKERPGVLLLATARHPASFRETLNAQLVQWGARPEKLAVRFIEDPATAMPAPGGRDELLIWQHDDVVAAAFEPAPLKELAGRLAAGGAAPSETLRTRLAAEYADGVVWVAGVDIGQVLQAADERSPGADGHRSLERSGLLDARVLILRGRGQGEAQTTEASLDFAGPRHGVASWLAAPGPMGSLGFVSPDATLASAIVFKDPAAMLDDVFELLGDRAPSLKSGLDEVGAKLGVDVRNDLVAPVGGEMAIAIDGPLVPTPAWKIVLEVYDPERLQAALESAVRHVSAEVAAQHEGVGLELAQDPQPGYAGRTFYVLREAKTGLSIHYAYVDGYMVLAPNRAMLDRTLRNRAAGVTLTASEKFRSMLPKDGQTDFSAVAYRQATPGLASLFAPAEGAKGPMPALIAAMGRPGLGYAYAGDNRITFAMNGGPAGDMDLALFTGLAAEHGPAGETPAADEAK